MKYKIFNITECIVKVLEDFDTKDFIDFLKDQHDNPLNCRNKHWFSVLLKDYKNPKYIAWFIIKHNNKIIAISAIQKIEQKLYRLLTRYTLDNDYRRPILHDYENYFSPSAAFATEQYKYIKNNFNESELFLIITMEDIKRRQALVRVINKLNLFFYKHWVLGSKMILTCDNEQSETCWQNYCYLNKEPKFRKMIGMDQWKTTFK